MLKVWKKSWEPFWRCLLISTANPAHFHPSSAGLAVLTSRQLPNGSHECCFKTNLAPLCCSHLRIPNSSSSISFWRRAGRTWLSLWFEENSTPPNFKRWCDFLRPAHSFLSFQFSQWGQSLFEVLSEKLCFYVELLNLNFHDLEP